ncbi:MAG TPA: cyclic nucleotide-binding domain-containing protein [Myxococcota bacterium]|nr:cyclic nucleotide-binding domain-containing protein [Myxococcota bacterium]
MHTPPHGPEILRSLQQNFLFSALTDTEAGDLAAKVWVEETSSGALIVRENDVADALFVVIEGGVNVMKANGQFLAFLGPGGFFGEMALFTQASHRTANCVATVTTRCLVVRKEVLDAFCAANPATGLKIYSAIIRTLAERLQATSGDLALLMGAQVQPQARISNLVEEAKRRVQKG